MEEEVSGYGGDYGGDKGRIERDGVENEGDT